MEKDQQKTETSTSDETATAPDGAASGDHPATAPVSSDPHTYLELGEDGPTLRSYLRVDDDVLVSPDPHTYLELGENGATFRSYLHADGNVVVVPPDIAESCYKSNDQRDDPYESKQEDVRFGQKARAVHMEIDQQKSETSTSDKTATVPDGAASGDHNAAALVSSDPHTYLELGKDGPNFRSYIRVDDHVVVVPPVNAEPCSDNSDEPADSYESKQTEDVSLGHMSRVKSYVLLAQVSIFLEYQKKDEHFFDVTARRKDDETSKVE
uniref:Uncharacterized protein n=1 Tax=Branchiostoma floridae TaxID=7739 RepID=C3YMB0_BRAFL|eukprot:XP_002602692.1 hypothetical protein BRAFLDRAFT_72947 [Branchiostoma floridae]